MRYATSFTLCVVHIIYGDLGANFSGSFVDMDFLTSAVNLVCAVCTTPISTFLQRSFLQMQLWNL